MHDNKRLGQNSNGKVINVKLLIRSMIDGLLTYQQFKVNAFSSILYKLVSR